MRVIDHKRIKSQNEKNVYKKHSNRKVLLVLTIVAVSTMTVYVLKTKESETDNSNQQTSQITPEDNTVVTVTQVDNDSKPFKEFTGEEFKNLYYSVAYPNTQQLNNNIEITGNDDADARIREMSEARGYKPTPIPQNAIVKINEPRLNGDDLLQPLAAKGWEALKLAAKNDGIGLSVISAYRSPEWQRDLFLSRLFVNGTTAAHVAAGIADNAVNNAITNAAVPGYSRHHTGYTIDLWCEDGSGAFAYSSCFKWINADNYLKAKQSGWIPSYPEGAGLQGPEPEPWEYVWVGTSNLK